MSAQAETSDAPTAQPPGAGLPRGAISPLAPVLVPLAVAAIALAALFSRLFPFAPAEGRPTTAAFVDVTRESGVNYVHDAGSYDGADTPTTLPGAVAFLDYDNDGLPDLLFASGVSWPWAPAGAHPATFALYHNRGHGRFEDVTKGSGLDVPMAAMSIAVGDYDGDGLPDVFVTGVGGNRLFHNLGGGRFEDVTGKAGVGGDPHVWSSGAAWIDIAGTGRLDLVVCNYARWSQESDLASAVAAERAGPSYTNRGGFVSMFPTVYRNQGNGRFSPVAGGTGLERLDRQTGYPVARPLAVAAVDVNADGRMDLLFTFQSGEDVLFLNQGDGTFRAWSPSATGQRAGGSAGLVGAGALSLSPGSASERFQVLRQAGLALGASQDESDAACRLREKLGVALADYDLDGRTDIISGEGVVESGIVRLEGGPPLAAPPQVLWGTGAGWTSAPLGTGSLGRPLVARGVAVADAEGNGSLYLVVAQNGGEARVYRRDLRSRRAWLRVDLVGTRCARDAWGAQVEVHTPRGIQVQTLEPATGYMAQSEKTLTFGLGDDDRVRRIVVRWPDGTRQEVASVEADRRIVITEP